MCEYAYHPQVPCIYHYLGGGGVSEGWKEKDKKQIEFKCQKTSSSNKKRF